MLKIISSLNLGVAIAAMCLSTLALVFDHTLDGVLPCVICAAWAASAVWLRRSRRLWPWVGSLVSVAVVTLAFGQGLLRVLIDVWRFQYGDRSVHLDPSTSGAALITFAPLTCGSLILLLGLLILPGLRGWKGGHAEQSRCTEPGDDVAVSNRTPPAPGL